MPVKKQKTDDGAPGQASPSAQVFDVARPGTLAPADATARPVIVTNREVMQDPLLTSGGQPETPTMKTDGKMVIQPIADAAEPPRAQAAGPEQVPADDPAPGPEVSTDAPANEVNNLDKQAAELEADAKAQDELDTLVDEKTYFLPINAVEQRRSRHVFIFGSILILILALAWLDVAMDAGFVSLPGVKPLTHLFRG